MAPFATQARATHTTQPRLSPNAVVEHLLSMQKINPNTIRISGSRARKDPVQAATSQNGQWWPLTGSSVCSYAHQSPEECEGHCKVEEYHQSQVQWALKQTFALLLKNLPQSKKIKM